MTSDLSGWMARTGPNFGAQDGAGCTPRASPISVEIASIFRLQGLTEFFFSFIELVLQKNRKIMKNS